MAFIIKTNLSQVADVLIRDMGIIVPDGGASVTLTDTRDLENAASSRDLRDRKSVV